MVRISRLAPPGTSRLSLPKWLIKFLLLSLASIHFASAATAQDSDASSSRGELGANAPFVSAQPRTLTPDAARVRAGNQDKFEWRIATRQAWLYTGVMHSFRFATEPGTRDTLNGPWFHDWMSSVSEIRGWDDGDPFITNYVAHSMEGAIFGFIQQQNDPRYREVVWGSGRDYWISHLHALAFAAVMSTQWKIGPASEASLGNVQLHESGGFVDFVNTPILGMCLMMGEDVADRYAIIGLENRTSNPIVLILARTLLNPSRTFANLMAFKEPWYRQARIGLFRENNRLRNELLKEHREGGPDPFNFVRNTSQEERQELPLEAPIELMASAHYESFLDGGRCIGGGGTGAWRITPSWQLIAELSGCKVMNMPTNESGDSEMVSIGSRWSPRASKRFSPYVQALIGDRRITHEIDDPEKKRKLLAAWNDGDGALEHYPKRSDYSTEHQANGFAMAMGGGLDIVITRSLAWRLANLEYTRSWLANVDQIRASSTVRLTSGLTLRIGTW